RKRMKPHSPSGAGESFAKRLIAVPVGKQRLEGNLTLPPEAGALVLFAHGSGSSRASPRNVSVARALQEKGIATLLFDLLTETEGTNRSNVFDISLLAERL